MSTIKDIAERTGLGLATISKYLNGGNVREANRAAIEKAIRELDYSVNAFARGLKTNHSRTVGVVIPELNNLFITTVITVLEDILRKSGYGILVCDCRSDTVQEADAVRFLLDKRVDGIVNMPVSQEGNHLQPALERGIPVVLADRMIPGLQGRVDAVLVDNAGGAERAVSAMIAAGHRDIGVILGPREVFTARQRLRGYRTAHKNASLPCRESRIIHRDYTVEGGYAGLKALVKPAPPSGVFVSNYELTLGAVIAANELGISLGKDLSMVGFDNLQLSQIVQPRLTIVTQPLREIGEMVAKALLEQMEGGARPCRTVVLPVGMQEGETVQAARGQV